jgi:hypothetical protein
MTGTTMQRGYDDTGYLRDMAEGLVVRTWGSVDEAAKAVLGEEGGSNVDRLRRKFREQNWYERGLSAHVEAEIARRGLSKTPGWLAAAVKVRSACFAPFQTVSAAAGVARARFVSGPPNNSMVAFSLATTLAFVAAASGAVTMEHALTAVVGCSLVLLGAWADRTSMTAAARTACLHLAGLAGLTFAVVAAFAFVHPSTSFTLGSSEGAMAAAAGMTTMGLYATSFVGAKTRRSGTRSNIEVACLIAALAIVSQVGTAVMIHDVTAAL